jgi:DNA-binding NtrC family response regulator
MVRILLIDDDDDFRSMLCIALKQDGNGYEGLRRYRAAPVDLVITDILMPEGEGLETIRTLRQECPEVKIIAMSGGGPGGNLNFLPVARLLGALWVLQKPFTLQELHDIVCEVLQPQAP